MAKVGIGRRVLQVQLVRILNGRPDQVTEIAKVRQTDADCKIVCPSKKSVQHRRVIFAFWIKLSRNNVFPGTKFFFRHKGLRTWKFSRYIDFSRIFGGP